MNLITTTTTTLPLLRRREHEIEIIQQQHHGNVAEKHEHGPKDPQNQRQRMVEEAVPEGVEPKPSLEQLGHVGRVDDAGVIFVGGAVDEEIDLVDEDDGEGVADEGEEEDEEERHVLERHHELPVGAVNVVVQRLLDAVRAADHRCQPRAHQDRRRRHQR